MNKIVFILIAVLTLNSCARSKAIVSVMNHDNKESSNVSPEDKNHEIFVAAKQNDLSAVNKFLGKGLNINSALEGAVEGKHDELIDNLISRGADINEAIIRAESEKLFLKKQNGDESQIHYYSNLIDRLLEFSPRTNINYGKLIAIVAIMKDNELLEKLLKNNNFLYVHLTASIMVDNHIAVKSILKDLRKDFCAVIRDKDYGLMSNFDVVVAAINYKKGCSQEFKKKGGHK